jgi:hypothetical protein
MDWDADAPAHEPAVAVAEAELRDDLRQEPALFQIRMPWLEFQGEGQRRINRLCRAVAPLKWGFVKPT